MSPLIRLLQTYPDKIGRTILQKQGFKSTYITTDVAHHHVYTSKGAGTLPPLVFLHGGSDSAATFGPVMIQLRQHVKKVVAVEAAGHGLSGEPTTTYNFKQHYRSMNTVLDTVTKSSGPAIFIGNSLGALTAMHYAHHNPTSVQGLFLISPMGAPMTKEQLDELRQAFTPQDLAQARAFTKRVRPSNSRLLTYLSAPLALAWLSRRAISELVQSTTLRDGISPKQLQHLTMPTHIIAGADDQIMDSDAVDYFRTHLPSSTTILQPAGMGHCPQHDQPRTIARMILKFIKSIG